MGKRKTKFQQHWLQQKDKNGDLLSAYIKPCSNDDFRCVCSLCDRQIDFGTAGASAIHQHASR